MDERGSYLVTTPPSTVTRWVGKIFGEAAVNDPTPFGLKRIDWSKVCTVCIRHHFTISQIHFSR